MAELFPKLFKYIFSLEGVSPAGPPVFVMHKKSEEEAIEADKNGTADLELCAPINGETNSSGDFNTYILPGGKMAKLTHKGPYEEMGTAYRYMFEWLEKEGKQITGFIREVYLNNPDEVQPSELLTEIHVPIR